MLRNHQKSDLRDNGEKSIYFTLNGCDQNPEKNKQRTTELQVISVSVALLLAFLTLYLTRPQSCNIFVDVESVQANLVLILAA